MSSKQTKLPASAPRSRAATSWWKKLGLALGAPLVFFALLEGGLQLAGFGRNIDFFIPDGPPGIYRTNPRFTELFFPASFGLKPLNFRLPRAKPAGSFRVFVLGESAAMGVPEPGFAVAPQLRAQLRAAYPDRNIEVYNLGITAINSHVIRCIAREAVQFQPDLLVIYMGNNEVVGPYGPGSAVTDALLALPLVRASAWIRRTCTGQLLQRALRGLDRVGRDFKEWRGMEMFAGRTVVANDPRLATVYGNFSANLAGILECARAAGIKTVLSTVAVNVKDSAPFASRHRPGLTTAQLQGWQQAVDQAGLAMGLGETARARALFEQALETDPGYADTHFLLAKVLDGLGEAALARRHYLEALQQDALRFRTDARLNEIIRHAAQAAPGAVVLADAARELGSDADSTVEPADHRFFFEHVHLTWEGNYALARLLAAPAAAALFGASPPPAPWLSPAACADAVGYTDIGRTMMLRHMDELTARPPFTGQLDFGHDRIRLKQEMAAVNTALAVPGALPAALGKIESARQHDPPNGFLVFHAAAVNLQLGRVAEALELNSRLPAMEPPSPEQAVQRAFLLQELKRTKEAEDLLLQAAAAEPYYFQTYGLLASLWAATGRTPQALEYFAGLVARMPESSGARLTYAQLLGGSGDWPAAEQQWQAVLRSTPDHEAALAALVRRLYERRMVDAALALMLKAFAYNPRNFANNARLEQVYEERDDLANTVKYMQAMADSGPVRAVLHADLAANLRKLGRREEMLVELQRARQAAAAEGDEALRREVDDLIRQESPGPR